MINLIIGIKRLFFKIRGTTPLDMEMVQYWKTGDAVSAKVMELDGVTVMKMEGEKYIFPGFPRAHILFGPLSKLKHEIKNQIFNESWGRLEKGASDDDIATYIRSVVPNIEEVFEQLRYDMIPVSKMSVPVRELHRAWTKVAPNSRLRDIVCMILQEDDAYRWRFQWMTSYMGFGSPLKRLERELKWLEHAEVIGDMKERVRLVRRVLLTALREKQNRAFIKALFQEVDWRKMRLTKADKYFFRAKYFKVDLDKFDY